jgi:hypothetical protein
MKLNKASQLKANRSRRRTNMLKRRYGVKTAAEAHMAYKNHMEQRRRNVEGVHVDSLSAYGKAVINHHEALAREAQAESKGYRQGYEAGKKEEADKLLNRRALTDLISAVGQALSVQSQTLENLSRILDNSGVLNAPRS